MNKLSLMFIGILCIFGTVFLALLVHEGVHIGQSKAPRSICYDMEYATLMHVKHNFSDYSDEELKQFITYTEKWAIIAERIVHMIIGFTLGIVLTVLYKEIKKRKG